MISAIILFHNEIDTIEKCIESVLWCDEVLVILDQMKTEKTCLKKNSEKIKMFIRTLDGDFSAQRNFGLEKAMGEWVLFVDADEVVSSALKKEIQDTIRYPAAHDTRAAHDTAEHSGYALKRKDYFLGRWLQYGETSSVRLVRLAKKDAGKWEGQVHEVWNIHGPVKELEEPLKHYPHQTVAHFLSSINFYTDNVSRHSGKRWQERVASNATATFDGGVQNLKEDSFRSWTIQDDNQSIDILLYPAGKFLHNYILRLGFLDGVPGLIMAMMMSFHSFLVRAKRWQSTVIARSKATKQSRDPFGIATSSEEASR